MPNKHKKSIKESKRAEKSHSGIFPKKKTNKTNNPELFAFHQNNKKKQFFLISVN